MKKEYNKPSMTIIETEIESILAASDITTGGSTSTNSITHMDSKTNTVGFNVWGDEEEE